MQQVSFYNNKPTLQIPFKGIKAPEINLLLPEPTQNLSKKSIKLMAAIDNYIERTWTDIRRGKITQNTPKFMHKTKNGLLTVTPVYNQANPTVLFEIDWDKYSQRILFDRKDPNKFRYEKTVITPYGCATLKSYNSSVEKNKNINNLVDSIILDNVANIVPLKILREYFSKNELKKNHYNEWILISN